MVHESFSARHSIGISFFFMINKTFDDVNELKYDFKMVIFKVVEILAAASDELNEVIISPIGHLINVKMEIIH